MRVEKNPINLIKSFACFRFILEEKDDGKKIKQNSLKDQRGICFIK